MTELEQFVKLFESMGVFLGHDEVDLTDVDHRATQSLSVGQQHFGFSESGAYVGMLSDDMGEWTRRSKEPNSALPGDKEEV